VTILGNDRNPTWCIGSATVQRGQLKLSCLVSEVRRSSCVSTRQELRRNLSLSIAREFTELFVACHRDAAPGLKRPNPSYQIRLTKGSLVSNFWDVLTLIASTFFFVAYLFVMFHIVFDLFRDSELGGGYKALWIIGLIFLPVVTALVYIIARGGGMAERQRAALQRARSETDSYIKQVAGKSPAEQIADAKSLLDAGTINQEEFARLKAKALA
jgi:ABC-type multidrug transport system fused ATPase/permease subunit